MSKMKPFRIESPEQKLADLRERLNRTSLGWNNGRVAKASAS